jgi:hypothetical protein
MKVCEELDGGHERRSHTYSSAALWVFAPEVPRSLYVLLLEQNKRSWDMLKSYWLYEGATRNDLFVTRRTIVVSCR